MHDRSQGLFITLSSFSFPCFLRHLPSPPLLFSSRCARHCWESNDGLGVHWTGCSRLAAAGLRGGCRWQRDFCWVILWHVQKGRHRQTPPVTKSLPFSPFQHCHLVQQPNGALQSLLLQSVVPVVGGFFFFLLSTAASRSHSVIPGFFLGDKTAGA